ncbi:coiled-coil domain-containing protein 55 [Fistulifera solaris]|uniref:Coiled-coil domain-containing protein 55 n=1 Tax=Fistulifera solaris TaxID=1519565 RepID=A0A1Z5J556_FISSO|nr:coiled-coil domain-containing protein 55 [Fistulifera solaris]|eukprot:GAX09210.1 coiled-coil domain-containing protein 55 [Fistulifera solaris]
MNINISAAAASKKKAPSKKAHSNVFGEDDDYAEPSSRYGVNQAVRSEQDAMKMRAQKATQITDASVYDYDGAYESFHKDPTAEQEEAIDDDRKSRYIADLLEAAKKRKHERDIVYEKKIAREQALEEIEQDFRGKEKFVTAAYRKKLEERELWLAQDEQQRKEDEENDVTKKVGGLGIASFYGNLNNNTALGGTAKNESIKSVTSNMDQTRGAANGQGWSESLRTDRNTFAEPLVKRSDQGACELTKEEVRALKVKEAFERYRIRNGLLVS